jgi:hypothetical protein
MWANSVGGMVCRCMNEMKGQSGNISDVALGDIV